MKCLFCGTLSKHKATCSLLKPDNLQSYYFGHYKVRFEQLQIKSTNPYLFFGWLDEISQKRCDLCTARYLIGHFPTCPRADPSQTKTYELGRSKAKRKIKLLDSTKPAFLFGFCRGLKELGEEEN